MIKFWGARKVQNTFEGAKSLKIGMLLNREHQCSTAMPLQFSLLPVILFVLLRREKMPFLFVTESSLSSRERAARNIYAPLQPGFRNQVGTASFEYSCLPERLVTAAFLEAGARLFLCYMHAQVNSQTPHACFAMRKLIRIREVIVFAETVSSAAIED